MATQDDSLGSQTGVDSSVESLDQQREAIAGELVTASAQIGHDNWLSGQVKRIFAPTALGTYEGEQTRSGMVRYKTMQFLESRLVESSDGKYTIDVTPAEFIAKHKSDMAEDSRFEVFTMPEELKYIERLVEDCLKADQEAIEQFNRLMVELATERIHDNDAYGRASVHLVERLGYDLTDLAKGMPKDLEVSLEDILEGISELMVVSGASELNGLLFSNSNLNSLMLSAHTTWREDKDKRLANKYDAEFKLNLDAEMSKRVSELENMLQHGKGEPERVFNLVDEIRDISQLQGMDADNTFNMILGLATKLEKSIESVNAFFADVASDDTSEAERIGSLLGEIAKTRDYLVSQIKWDANPAIIEGIRAVAAKHAA